MMHGSASCDRLRMNGWIDKKGTILNKSCFGSLLACGVELGLSFLCNVMKVSTDIAILLWSSTHSSELIYETILP